MKKILSIISIVLLFCAVTMKIYAQSDFIKAIKTCESYSQDGAIEHDGEVFNIRITLDKAKDNKCIYREKIYQVDFIANSMTRFSDMFKKQIAKNRIFEAKLTTNGEVFQKYLANPQYCKITHSKK